MNSIPSIPSISSNSVIKNEVPLSTSPRQSAQAQLQWQLIDIQNLPLTAWLNGRGTTRELLRYPAHSLSNNFEYRVSFANLTQSDEFSKYPNMGRLLILLSGDGVVLTDKDGKTIPNLTKPFEPYPFDGDLYQYATLAGSPSVDMGLIYRSDIYEGKAKVWRENYSENYFSCSDDPSREQFAALFCPQGSWEVTLPDNSKVIVSEGQALTNVPPGQISIKCMKNESVFISMSIIRRDSK